VYIDEGQLKKINKKQVVKKGKEPGGPGSDYPK